jgi:hypothetical protein
MPLVDHFRAPLYPTHSWESFHSRWANAIADLLDRTLPGRFFAEVHMHLGGQVAADVAEFEGLADEAQEGNGAAGGVAVQTWAPPAAVQTLAMVFPDDIEVRVFDHRGGARLAAVIELVSPSNKDRPETRRAFAAKCVAYLERGVGLLIADVVTERGGNLHAETLRLLGQPNVLGITADAELYAAAYRPCHRDAADLIDVWAEELALGRPLPVLPLALRGAFCVPLDLEETYTEARRRSRL